MSQTSLELLASIVHAKATHLSKAIQGNGLEPSSSKIPVSGVSDVDRLKTRNELIEATTELLQLVMGPTEYLYSLALSGADIANLDLLIRFKIPQNVPLDSSITTSALSAAVHLPEKNELIRAIRLSIANGIFREPTPGHIAHSLASTALSNDSYLRDVICFATLWSGSVLTKVPEFLQLQVNNGDSEIPETTFNHVFHTNEDFFQYLAHSEDLNAKYHRFLMGRVRGPMWPIDHLRTAWDWRRLGSNLLVDVGGSTGHTAIAIAPLAPNAHFIVQDNDSHALEMGRTLVSELLDARTRSQIMFQKHNFFEDQPVCAEYYILRHILHDWKDQECIAILKALLPALEPGAKVFVSEGILPDPPARRLNRLASKLILIEDQVIMAAHGSHERTVADFLQLFKQASSRFHLIGVTSGAKDGAFQSLLEFGFR